MDIIEQVKQFPLKPGVYIMKDSFGTIIYVGKAKKLRNRVLQYFRKSKNRAPKIDALVCSIYSIEYILTDTELEAFLTESRLIKEIKPKYNSQMKNDKGYLYIKININERYPGVTFTIKKDSTGSLFFGPYTSQGSVERTVSFMKEYFLIRNCSTSTFSKKTSGCLNYSLGTCMGVCREDAEYNAYRECISKAVLFLEGKDTSVAEALKERIGQAAEKLEFEKAAKYRDDLRALNHVLNKQNLILSSKRRRNIIAIERMYNNCFKLFLFKGNRLLNIESFDAGVNDKAKAIDFFYTMIMDKFINMDMNENLSQQDIDEAQIIYSYLKHKKNNIISFWIPSNWLDNDNSKLRFGLNKIVNILYR